MNKEGITYSNIFRLFNFKTYIFTNNIYFYDRYREHVIGACRNSSIEVVDGKTVESNSRIMMKNLAKMREASELSTSNEQSRINNASRTPMKISSHNPTSAKGNRRNLQNNSQRNGGNNLLSSSHFEPPPTKFDARIASPSTAVPSSKRNESSASSMTTTSSISTLSSLSENTSSGSRSTTQEKGHGGPSKRTGVAASIKVPASIDENGYSTIL